MKELNETIHQTVRLRLMAALVTLRPEDQVDFTYLRELLKLTDGNLGAHLIKLEEAEYIRVEKMFVGRKPHTFIAVTDKGRAAFHDHVEALREILDKAK